jgi:ferredoxin
MRCKLAIYVSVSAVAGSKRSSSNMRIVVDLNRCLGYAQCVPLAPEVLQLNGEEALAYDPNPDVSQRQRVARAVASCPVQAIIAEMDPPADRTTI